MQYLDSPYPVRPRPIDGESFLGYILRLAAMNGRQTLAQFFNDFSSQIQTSCFFVRSDAFYHVLPYFADAINMPAKDLKVYFEHDGLLLDVASNVFYRTAVGKPVFCPHCLVQTGHIKAKWLQLHVNHCEVHECKLLHACPECAALQNWESALLRGCTNCEHKWAATKHEKVALPIYEQMLAKMAKHQEREYLEVLYTCVVFAMRPFDVTHDKYHKVLEQIWDTSEYFEFAHQLAALEQVRKDYATHRKRHFQTALKFGGKDKLLEGINLNIHAANEVMLNKNALPHNQRQLSQKVKIPVEATHNILTVNRRLHHASNDSHYHLEWEDAKRMLSMSRVNILHLIDEGVLKRRTHKTCDSKLIAPPLNDILDLHGKLCDRAIPLSQSHVINVVNWSKAKSILRSKKKHSDLIIAALRNEISIYTDCLENDFLLHELFFEEQEVQNVKDAV